MLNNKVKVCVYGCLSWHAQSWRRSRVTLQVSLGVDGSASNDSGNVLSEARLCMLLQRVGEKRAAAIGAREALRLATRGGASVLGREECGYLAPGMAADFVAWSTDDPGFAGALHDKLAALLFCIPSKGVDTSVINGIASPKLARVAMPGVPSTPTLTCARADFRLCRAPSGSAWCAADRGLARPCCAPQQAVCRAV